MVADKNSGGFGTDEQRRGERRSGKGRRGGLRWDPRMRDRRQGTGRRRTDTGQGRSE